MPQIYAETSTDNAARNNIWNFYLPIEMPGLYYFDHVRTLKRIELYYNSQFEKGKTDSRGFMKYFYNIVKPACDIASKFVKLETKDIMLIPDHSDFEETMWLMRQDLREWLRENKFNHTLSSITHNLPKYGSVVLKKDKTQDFHFVNILNLRFDVAARSLEESHFLYEMMFMHPREMREMSGWDQDAVTELIARETSASKYSVYETYDYNMGEGKKWKRTIRGDLFSYYGRNYALVRTNEARINRPTDYVPSIVLYEDEVEELPYRELHFERIPGRWLGLGFVEYLFDNQIRRNEIANVKAKGLLWTSLKLFQTKDQTVGNNILTDVENGDIVKITSEITPITMEERNLAYFNEETADWDKNKIEKTFTTDVSKGENLPSRTPLGVANLQMSMVTSFFEGKRAEIGMFIRDLIVNDVISRFRKEIAPKHKLMFAGSQVEMDKMATSIAKAILSEKSWEYAARHGVFPAQHDQDAELEKLKMKLLSKKGIDTQIPEGFYENAKYRIDVLTTGEQVDTVSVRQTLMTTLQIIGTNPAVLQDPAMRSILFMMMALSGVDPVELDLMQQAMQQGQQQQQQNPQQLPQGGSVSVPKAISNPSFIPKKQIL